MFGLVAPLAHAVEAVVPIAALTLEPVRDWPLPKLVHDVSAALATRHTEISASCTLFGFLANVCAKNRIKQNPQDYVQHV